MKDVAKAGAEGAYVKGTAKLPRMDFEVGTPSSKDSPTGEDVTVELEVTVSKT